MARRLSVEKTIRVLREVEVLQSQGSTIGDACRKVGVTEHSYYRWKKEYGRLSVDQARRLKELQPDLPILMITAFPSELNLRKSPADALVSKPFTIDQLHQGLISLIQNAEALVTDER